jgi:hypothetical protein
MNLLLVSMETQAIIKILCPSWGVWGGRDGASSFISIFTSTIATF